MTAEAAASPTVRGHAASTGLGRRTISARTYVDVAVLLVLVALGVIGFEPSFGGYGFLLAGIGGLVVGAGTGILTSLFRLGTLSTSLVAIVVYFLLGTPFAVPAQALFGVLPSFRSMSSLAVGAVFGWADIVTLRTPIGAPEYIAVVPFVATWVVTLVSVSLALRWLPGHRTAWRFGVALIGPFAIYLAGVLVGTREPYLAGLRGVAFAVIALVWLGWRRASGEQVASAGAARLRQRKLAGTALLLVGAVVLGGGAAILIAPPRDSRFVLREEIQPPFDPLQYPSPLSGFRHYTKDEEAAVLFTVKGLQPGDVIRLATLDSFSGKLWTVTGPQLTTDGSGSFSLVGRQVPSPKFITSARKADVTFTIGEYNDVWLPGVGYPIQFDLLGKTASQADDLRYNSATGTTVLTSGLTKGDSYRLVGEVQSVIDPTDLDKVAVASLQLPPVVASPDIATAKAQEFSASAATPEAKLEAIRHALVDGGFLSHGRASDAVPSRAGHGADRIKELLERPQLIGDAEQYASAFALMARSLGYPARVVMGFKPDIAAGQASVDVVGDDVTAWVEVAFDGVGWVAFDPTPDDTDVPQDQTPKPKSEPQPQVRQPPRAQKDDDALLTPVELDKSNKDDKNLPFVLPGWVYVVAASVLIPAGIVFIPLLVIGGIKARRLRRRRFTATGHDSAAGAWEELVDQYAELGYAVPGNSTRGIAASSLEHQVIAPEPVRLGALATKTDEAVFSGETVDPKQSEVVWTEALAAVALARSAVSRGRRIIGRYRIARARRKTGTDKPSRGSKAQ
ncbi:MAG: transglutaminase domain-containing protein [Pseudolysinimonas sp.]